MDLEVLYKKTNNKHVYIYGAQTTAYDIALALLSMKVSIKNYVVTNKSGNPEIIDDIYVKSIDEICNSGNELFLIAVPEYLHAEIIAVLEKRGFNNYICIDSSLEYDLLKRFYQNNGELKFAEDFYLPSRAQITQNNNRVDNTHNLLEIYVANSFYDKPLRKKSAYPKYYHYCQAGADLDPPIASEFKDNEGNNISFLNRNYDELTVTYWAWKNRKPKYKGIAHYRRYIDLSDVEINLLLNNNIDAIMPIPFYGWPTAEMQFGRYNEPIVIETMLSVIKELYPDEYEAVKKILYGKYVYNYNMLIAKTEIFNAYCEWMFPVLFEAEKRLLPFIKEKGKHPRVCGHLGEILTSIYFQLHKELKIIHGRKIWLL